MVIPLQMNIVIQEFEAFEKMGWKMTRICFALHSSPPVQLSGRFALTFFPRSPLASRQIKDLCGNMAYLALIAKFYFEITVIAIIAKRSGITEIHHGFSNETCCFWNNLFGQVCFYLTHVPDTPIPVIYRDPIKKALLHNRVTTQGRPFIPFAYSNNHLPMYM